MSTVDHPPEPLCVTGAFGSGKTTALHARAQRLRESGRVTLSFDRPSAVVPFAVDVLERHGDRRRLLDDADQRAMVRTLVAESPGDWDGLDADDPAFADEVAATVLRYQSSFLGSEELFVHADAAGELGRWQALHRFTERYLAAHLEAGTIDRAGAIVAASMRLRDPEILAAERAGFDDLLVDDFQLADFATNRLLTQLAGRTGSLTVAGNAGAAIGGEHGASARFLTSFARRFACETIDLGDTSHRGASAPYLRLVGDSEDRRALVDALVTARPGGRVLARADVWSSVGHEWPVVVIPDGSADVWPSPRRPHRWFDPHLFSGPDVPADSERDEAWRGEERRRFAIACSRSTEQTVIVASPPVTPFLRDLIA